jgi:hypothetical protein
MTTYQTTPAPAPQRPRKRRRIRQFIIPAAALLLGVGMGAGAAGQPQTVEVEKRVEVPVEKIVEKRVEVPGPTVEKVPASCLTALDYSDKGFTLTSDIMKALQSGIATGDFSEATAPTDELGALAPKYNTAKTACRAAGE